MLWCDFFTLIILQEVNNEEKCDYRSVIKKMFSGLWAQQRVLQLPSLFPKGLAACPQGQLRHGAAITWGPGCYKAELWDAVLAARALSSGAISAQGHAPVPCLSSAVAMSVLCTAPRCSYFCWLALRSHLSSAHCCGLVWPSLGHGRPWSPSLSPLCSSGWVLWDCAVLGIALPCPSSLPSALGSPALTQLLLLLLPGYQRSIVFLGYSWNEIQPRKEA